MCKIIAVTNRKVCKGDFLQQITWLCEGGVDAIVLREKDLREEAYEELAKKVFAICSRYHTVCILHQYVEVAKRQKAPYMHLPGKMVQEQGIEAGQWKEVGMSIHSLEELEKAQKAGATYVFAGHIFDTSCKAGIPGRGLAFLKEMLNHASLPVYAIGGITPENIQKVQSLPVAGVCLMSWAMNASLEEIRALKQI